jgi:hypothetical protein
MCTSVALLPDNAHGRALVAASKKNDAAKKMTVDKKMSYGKINQNTLVGRVETRSSNTMQRIVVEARIDTDAASLDCSFCLL